MRKQKLSIKTKDRKNIPANPQKIRAYKSKQKNRSLGLSR